MLFSGDYYIIEQIGDWVDSSQVSLINDSNKFDYEGTFTYEELLDLFIDEKVDFLDKLGEQSVYSLFRNCNKLGRTFDPSIYIGSGNSVTTVIHYQGLFKYCKDLVIRQVDDALINRYLKSLKCNKSLKYLKFENVEQFSLETYLKLPKTVEFDNSWPSNTGLLDWSKVERLTLPANKLDELAKLDLSDCGVIELNQFEGTISRLPGSVNEVIIHNNNSLDMAEIHEQLELQHQVNFVLKIKLDETSEKYNKRFTLIDIDKLKTFREVIFESKDTIRFKRTYQKHKSARSFSSSVNAK